MDPQAPNPENKNNDPTNLDLDPPMPATEPATPDATPAPAAVPMRTEEDVYQSANQNMELDQTSPAPQPLPVKQKRSKKPLVIILLVLVLVGAAVGAWYFMSQKQSEPVVQQTTPAETVEAPTYEPNSVAYAFRANTTDPVALYTRPAAGGDRTEIQKLTRDAAIVSSDTAGSNVAFADNNVIYASTDNGASYKKVYEGAAGTQITSLIIDADGSGVAFGLLTGDQKENQVTSVDFNGENKKVLFTDTEQGIVLRGWSSKKDRIIYQSFAKVNSDGQALTPYTYDTKENKKTRLLQDVDPKRLVSFASSSDTSQVIYVVGVVKTSTDDPFDSLVAPYNVSTLSVEDNKSTEVSTVGKDGEKNPNGTPLVRNFLTGFTAGTNTAYYATGEQLFLVRDGEGLVFFEADKEIVEVYYVSDKHVIVSTGAFDNFVVFNYDVSAKKSTNILNGDAQTNIFGVTTD